MILYKKMQADIEVLNKLEMYNMLYGAHKQVLISVLNKKADIEINEERFDKYINEYIEAYVNYNVYFNAVASENVPSYYDMRMNDNMIYIMFRDNTIHVQTEDESFIKLLLDNGFVESNLEVNENE